MSKNREHEELYDQVMVQQDGKFISFIYVDSNLANNVRSAGNGNATPGLYHCMLCACDVTRAPQVGLLSHHLMFMCDLMFDMHCVWYHHDVHSHAFWQS